jgi:hypothetical protein
MNHLKIALLMALGLIATACGNNKTPNALSPSVAPTVSAPITASPETPITSPVAPLPGAPPLVPGTIPSSGVNSPGGSAVNGVSIDSTGNAPPRRKKARIKKVVEPSPKVTYYDTPATGKPRSKPAKTVKRGNEEDSSERVQEKPQKSPTKPAKKPIDNGDEEEKVPPAKPAKSPKAETDVPEGKKLKQPAEEAENKNQGN